MKIARVTIGTQVVLACVEGDKATLLARDAGESWIDPLRVWLETGRPVNATDVLAFSETNVLAPVRAPQKIVCVGLNYTDHAAEQNKPLPKAPMFFGKAPSAIVGPGDDICFASDASSQVDYEAELAVVIDRRCRNVSVEEALDYVFGYTVCNDVSARDAQADDGQYYRAKSFDTFCPLGPWIVTADEVPDVQNLRITTKVNGELRQNGTTADMVFGVAEIISYASRFFTLEAGDVIPTGTPAGVGSGLVPPRYLQNNDTVEVAIEGIGAMTNTVRIS